MVTGYYLYRRIFRRGLTDNIFKIRKKSPDSTILFYKELQEMPIPFVQKVRANINYWRFAKFSKRNFTTSGVILIHYCL